jgi:hypothetical protein
VVTALLCTTWPSGRDMIDPGARSAVDEHVSAGSRQAFDRPPRKPAAAAALLTAASALGINLAGGQYAATTATYSWLSNQGPDRFTKALRDIAEGLDLTSGLTNYRRRRESLQNWSLTPSTWHEIITSLPPVPGPVRPSLDDRKRQEASAFIWARITGGEPLFAPRAHRGRPA